MTYVPIPLPRLDRQPEPRIQARSPGGPRPSPTRSRSLRWTLVPVACFWLGVFAVAASILIPRAVGIQSFVLLGHSMTGTIPIGSMVFSRDVAVSTLRRGDIITFKPSWAPKPVTHRIVKIERLRGKLAFWTKGDANRDEDPQPQTFAHPVVALYQAHVPLIGWSLWALSKYGFWLIGIPALVFGITPMLKLWRESTDETDILVPELFNVSLSNLKGIR